MVWYFDKKRVYPLGFLFLFPVFVNGADVCSSDGSAVNQLTAQVGGSLQKVSSPEEGASQHSRATCAWQISATAGNIIELVVMRNRFTDYTGGDDCNVENLKIYDGTSSGSALLGLFCESKLSNRRLVTLFSTGPSIRLELKTGNNSTNTSFQFGFEAYKQEACTKGSVIDLPMASTTPQYIQSPYLSSYSYPQNVLCSWKIQAPSGKGIKLTLNKLIMECNDTQVTVYDGADSSKGNFDESFCGGEDGESYKTGGREVYSKGEHMVVTFKSTSDYAAAGGFKAVYEVVSKASSCSPSNSQEANQNIIVSATSGTLTTPGYPSTIPDVPLACVWKLKAPAGQRIRLDLDSVNLDGGPMKYMTPCPIEMFVKSGFNGNSYNLYYNILCRTATSMVTSSDGRRMWIMYNQTAEITKRERPVGFSLRYKAEPLVTTGSCKRDSENTIKLKGEGSSFSSPGFPVESPANMKCHWKIKVPDGMTIELRLKSLTSSSCSRAWIRVYDGGSTKSRALSDKQCSYDSSCEPYRIRFNQEVLHTPSFVLHRQCKDRGWSTFYSTGNAMLLEQVTSAFLSAKGFIATFTAVKTAPYACRSGIPQDLKALKGKLASQGYPLPYPNYILCKWVVTVPFSYRIKLTFKTFSLQQNSTGGCNTDYVQFDGAEGPRRLCGNQATPKIVMSAENKMTIYFKSDKSGRYPGFDAEYEAVPDPSFGNCTVQGKDNQIFLAGDSGAFFSPRYPKSFPTNMKCTWVITVPKGKRVKLRLKPFNLDSECQSHLEVRDGATKDSILLGKFCGWSEKPNVYSSGEKLWVRFDTSVSGYGDNFYATFEAVNTQPLSIACRQSNSDLSEIELKGSPTGAIASFDYPLKYDNDVTCVWQIEVADWKRIKLTFDSFGLEQSDGCKADYVEIRNGYSFKEKLGRYCGSSSPPPVYSTDSMMWIKFKTNGTGRYGGFKASYEQEMSNLARILIASGVAAFLVIIAISVAWQFRRNILGLCSGSSGGGGGPESVALKPVNT